MNKILAISGRKQSGKNTSFNFLLGLEMLKLSLVRGKFMITDDGKLLISDILGDTKFDGVFDIDRHNETMKRFREESIYPFIRNHSFADCLKQEVCINILGLSWEQCYGTDEQKMSETHLKWEDMPGVTTEKTPEDPVDAQVAGRLGQYYEKVLSGMIYHEPGIMTGREVMQYVGTEIFRKMYNNVWAERTLKNIIEYKEYVRKQTDNKGWDGLAVITDCRFPNEVETTQKHGGKVIRLTRCLHPEDTHASETSLDKENFDWDKFDAVIDNQNLSIEETNKKVYETLAEWGWVDHIEL